MNKNNKHIINKWKKNKQKSVNQYQKLIKLKKFN